MLQVFKYYCDLGLQPIPIYSNSKIPVGHGWNNVWNREKAKNLFSNKILNIGILLGDILDVEGDSEEANNFLEQIIGDYSHPIYKGSKSIHHLFLNKDKNLTRISKNDIEFRGYKHQSVMPPSIHPDGTEYVWINEFFPIPDMPPSLLDFYESIKKEKTKKIKSFDKNIIIPWCSICRNKIKINKKRFNKELIVFKNMSQNWQCKKCRKIDIRNYCKKLKKIPK